MRVVDAQMACNWHALHLQKPQLLDSSCWLTHYWVYHSDRQHATQPYYSSETWLCTWPALGHHSLPALVAGKSTDRAGCCSDVLVLGTSLSSDLFSWGIATSCLRRRRVGATEGHRAVDLQLVPWDGVLAALVPAVATSRHVSCTGHASCA